MIRILFCRKHTIGSIMLRGFLWSQWSHVAIIDGDHVIEAIFGHGVVRRPLQEVLDECSYFEIVPFMVRDPELVIAAAGSQVGKPYDWQGVVGIGVRRKWQDMDAWFCSELVAWAFQEAGQPLFRVHAWRITPRDLYLPL